jgi:hypothetical protein
LEKVLTNSLPDRLEAAYEQLSEDKIKAVEFFRILEEETSQCRTLNDVDTIMFYSMLDDTSEGLIACERIADNAIAMLQAEKLQFDTSLSFQYKTLAEHFVAFGKPNSKVAFTKLFDLAVKSARNCFDFEILVSSLVSARNNIHDQSIDTDLKMTRELTFKAFELALIEGNKLSLETLAYVAEHDLGDKKLAKEIKDARKKIK